MKYCLKLFLISEKNNVSNIIDKPIEGITKCLPAELPSANIGNKGINIIRMENITSFLFKLSNFILSNILKTIIIKIKSKNIIIKK